MTTRFELHLVGMDVPEGLIDADRLVEIVRSLQDMATRLGRLETTSAQTGRPSRELDRVATLRIGLERGSTTIIAERHGDPDALSFGLPDEESVDRRFGELIASIGADRRPDWVTDSVARAAEGLVTALMKTAPRVEFTTMGVQRAVIETGSIHRETWGALASESGDERVSFTGRLFHVNLNTHRLEVQDDVGHTVALPEVSDDAEVGKLLGCHVTVTGAPLKDRNGKLAQIAGASVELAPDIGLRWREMPAAPIEEILRAGSGPKPGGIPELTEDEIEAFLDAIS